MAINRAGFLTTAAYEAYAQSAYRALDYHLAMGGSEPDDNEPCEGGMRSPAPYSIIRRGEPGDDWLEGRCRYCNQMVELYGGRVSAKLVEHSR